MTLMRRLDALSAGLALGAGFGASLLLGALLLTPVSPVMGAVAEVMTDEETAELAEYERFEHLVRLLKARVLQKR